MDMLVWVGTIIGMSFGLFHAVYVYRFAVTEPPADSASSRVRSFYYAFSTFVLWALFGTYVLVLWLVGAVFFAVFKAFRKWIQNRSKPLELLVRVLLDWPPPVS